jgi:hypothetical protein
VIKITEDTTIVWARDNLHQGGESVDIKVNNKVVCLPEAKYSEKPDRDIETMTLCPTPIQLHKGDNVTITSVYDLPKHPL